MILQHQELKWQGPNPSNPWFLHPATFHFISFHFISFHSAFPFYFFVLSFQFFFFPVWLLLSDGFCSFLSSSFFFFSGTFLHFFQQADWKWNEKLFFPRSTAVTWLTKTKKKGDETRPVTSLRLSEDRKYGKEEEKLKKSDEKSSWAPSFSFSFFLSLSLLSAILQHATEVPILFCLLFSF